MLSNTVSDIINAAVSHKCRSITFSDGVTLRKNYENFIFVGDKAKGQISKRVFQENKARQIFRKTNISNPLIRTHACFVFLKHPFWDSPFSLITDYFTNS